MSRALSEDRKKVRAFLRLAENEGVRALHGDDIADRTKLDRTLIPDIVLRDLKAGLKKMSGIIATMEQDGKSHADIFNQAVRRNPYPMWVNLSRYFGESVFFHLTFDRFGKMNAYRLQKETAQKMHRYRLMSEMADASPALKDAFKPEMKALKSGAPDGV